MQFLKLAKGSAAITIGGQTVDSKVILRFDEGGIPLDALIAKKNAILVPASEAEWTAANPKQEEQAKEEQAKSGKKDKKGAATQGTEGAEEVKE